MIMKILMMMIMIMIVLVIMCINDINANEIMIKCK